MSKYYVRIIFPIIFVAMLFVTIFGFSIMNGPGHMTVGCGDAFCSMLSPLAHVSTHIQTFQGISTALVIALFLLGISLVVIAAFLRFRNKDGPGDRLALRRLEHFVSPPRIQLTHWLSLHEKRDPSFAYAVSK